MNFIDNINLVLPHLRRDTDLINEVADIINSIIGSSIQLINIERCILIEGDAGGAFIAGFNIRRKVFTIYRLCQDPCTGGFPNTPRTTKKKGLCQLIITDGIF